MAPDIKRYLRKTGPLYHALSVLYVYLNRHSQLCEVPIDICTNPMGFSFAPNGWNYLIEQLKRFDDSPDAEVKDSVLYRFHQSYRPEGMSDLPVSAGIEVAFKPGLSIYPWGSFDMEKSKSGGKARNAHDTRFYGPSSFTLIEKDLSNLLNLYEYMKRYGYRPWHFRNAFIGGVFLERTNGQRKFVILQGNHRTAILAHLGQEKILTRYLKGHYRCIREQDINEWFYVKSGECSIEDAVAYISSFFKLDGTERAKAMGFLA
ncbi:MAG: hypothetical protein ACYTEK_00075 [Planctomycetota bacterium]